MHEQAGNHVLARHQPHRLKSSTDMPVSSSQISWQDAKVLQQLLTGAVQPTAKSVHIKELCQHPGCAAPPCSTAVRLLCSESATRSTGSSKCTRNLLKPPRLPSQPPLHPPCPPIAPTINGDPSSEGDCGRAWSISRTTSPAKCQSAPFPDTAPEEPQGGAGGWRRPSGWRQSCLTQSRWAP